MATKFAVTGDAGSSGIPSFLYTGTLEEVIEAAEKDWKRYGDPNQPDEPLGEPGEHVYYLWIKAPDWGKVHHAETLTEIRGWSNGK